MRIGCLQFAPSVGDVDNNLNRADEVLENADPEYLDLLVLPELAFSGYNFSSLTHITPCLEYLGRGVSSLWAKTTALKHDCTVIVGYPEKIDLSDRWPADPEYYNAAVVMNSEGDIVGNYRKAHLYYTDETWALEGPDGFFSARLSGLGPTALGICMDLNPHKFEAPWDKFEFARYALDCGAHLIVLSCAWLTQEDPDVFLQTPQEPDMQTLMYWVARLEPIIRIESNQEVIVVFANRTGTEGSATYAGTSAVIGIQSGEVRVYGILGRGEKELLVVDTDNPPYAKLVYRPEGEGTSVNGDEPQPAAEEEVSLPSRTYSPERNPVTSSVAPTATEADHKGQYSTANPPSTEPCSSAQENDTPNTLPRTTYQPSYPDEPRTALLPRSINEFPQHTERKAMNVSTRQFAPNVTGETLQSGDESGFEPDGFSSESNSHNIESSMELPPQQAKVSSRHLIEAKYGPSTRPHQVDDIVIALDSAGLGDPHRLRGRPNLQGTTQGVGEEDEGEDRGMEEEEEMETQEMHFPGDEASRRIENWIDLVESPMDFVKTKELSRSQFEHKRPLKPHRVDRTKKDRPKFLDKSQPDFEAICRKLEDIAQQDEMDLPRGYSPFVTKDQVGHQENAAFLRETSGMCNADRGSGPKHPKLSAPICFAAESAATMSADPHSSDQAPQEIYFNRIGPEPPILRPVSRSRLRGRRNTGDAVIIPRPQIESTNFHFGHKEAEVHPEYEPRNLSRGRQRAVERPAEEQYHSRAIRRQITPKRSRGASADPVNLAQFHLIEEYPSANCPLHGSRSRSRARHQTSSRQRRPGSGQSKTRVQERMALRQRTRDNSAPRATAATTERERISSPPAALPRQTKTNRMVEQWIAKDSDRAAQRSASAAPHVGLNQGPKTPVPMVLLKR